MGALPPCIQLIAQQSTWGVQTAVGTRYMMIPTTKTFYVMDIVDIIAMMDKTQSITVCFLLFFHILIQNPELCPNQELRELLNAFYTYSCDLLTFGDLPFILGELMLILSSFCLVTCRCAKSSILFSELTLRSDFGL